MEDLLTRDPVFLTSTERQQLLRDLTRLENRVAAAKLRVLAVSDDIGLETGARSTAHWLAAETRESVGTTLAWSRVAEAVDRRWTGVGAAMAAGAVNLAQARVITDALDRLPGSLEPEVVGKGEAYL